MPIGYMRVREADGSQALDLQPDALLTAGVEPERLYEDHASGKRDDRPGLEACLKVLPGQSANLDAVTANGRLVPGMFAALAEFRRELIVERTQAGLASARARGRSGSRPFKTMAAKLCLAQAAMGQPGTKVGEPCAELGVSRQMLYRHVRPMGELRPDGLSVLSRRKRQGSTSLQAKHG